MGRFVACDVFERRRRVAAVAEALDEARGPRESCDSREQAGVMTGLVRRRQKHEEGVHGLSVHRPVVRTVRADSEQDGRALDRRADGVRHCDPVPDTRAEYFLPREKGGENRVGAGDTPRRDEGPGQLPEDALDIVVLDVRDDQFF